MDNCTDSLKNAPLNTRATEFIDRAHLMHGDRYDYENVVYLNVRTKVTIVCPIHGSFGQRPCNHLKGYGCRRCANQLQTTEDFIKKAELRHGNRYCYPSTVYETSRKSVKIVCRIHGPFEQK